MVRRRWMRWGAVGAVAAVALTGCVGEEEPAPSGATSNAPTESSEEELRDEARAAYEGFLGAALAMWDEPEVDYTEFLPWANDEVATSEAAAHESLRAQGVAEIGPVTLNAFDLADGPTPEEVDVWLCLDFSEATRLDASGQDITPADAQVLVPLQVRFEPGNDGLIITQQEALPATVESPCV